MEMKRVLVCAAAAAMLAGAASGARAAGKRRVKKGKAAKERRVVSGDKRFSLVIPRDSKRDRFHKEGVLGWIGVRHDRGATLFPAPRDKIRFKTPLRMAREHRKERSGKSGGASISKVVKKTLSNKLVFYHWWEHQKGSRDPGRIVHGYADIGGKVYYLRGTASREAKGLHPLYAVLGSIMPMYSDKMRRSSLGGNPKPSIIRDQEEKTQGVPLY